MQLSAVVKRGGHDSYLHMDNGRMKSALRVINEVKPDIIGFSVMTGQHGWAAHTAAVIKRNSNGRNYHILLGGAHPTFAPEIIERPGIDIICRGEGDGALLDLMNCVDKDADFSHIPNLWVKLGERIVKNELRPPIEDLDSLPFPDRGLFYRYSYFRNNPNKMVMASRDCSFNCSFCFNERYRELYNMRGTVVKRKSPRNFIDEIKLLKREYANTKVIRFQDDIFTLDRDWLYNFLEIYKREIRLPFVCQIRAGVDNEETVRRLSGAGCACVAFGVETGNEELRRRIFNKKVSDEQIYDTARLLKKHNIKFWTNNIFFFPGRAIDDIWGTIEMNQRIKPDYFVGNIFQPYPGTVLNAELLKAGLIREDYSDSVKTLYSFPQVNLADKNQEKNIYYFSYLLIKFPWLTPLIKRLIKLSPNVFFLLIFKLTAGIGYWLRNNLSFLRFLREVYHHYDFG